MNEPWRSIDSLACWELGTAIRRERLVRARQADPTSPDEHRQRNEGPVGDLALDAMKGPAA